MFHDLEHSITLKNYFENGKLSTSIWKNEFI